MIPTESAPARKTDESRFLKALLTSVASRLSAGDVVGLSSPTHVSNEGDLQVAGCEFTVRRAESVLQIRQYLAEAETRSGHLVLVTPLQTPQVGSDVRARLFRHQLLPVDEWEAVRSIFHPRQIDPRLLTQRHLATHLVAAAPADGPPSLPGGVLSADIAWRLLLERSLGFPGPVDELRDIMEWAASNEVALFLDAPETLRTAAIEWLEKSLGRLAGVWLRCVAEGRAADVLPLGLVCRVVFHESDAGAVRRKVGAALLEQHTRVPLEPREGVKWAEVAETLVADLARDSWEGGGESNDPARVARVQRRAEAILDGVRLAEYAWLSDVLPSGFEQRLERFATELASGLSTEARLLQAQDQILACGRDVQRHTFAARHEARARRVTMAIRLLRWMSETASATRPSTSLADQAALWVVEDSFVDRARLALHGDEPNARLAQACRQLVERATMVRQEHNRAFAERLAQASSRADGLLGVENLLDKVLIPLARQTRVLLVVLDGLSWPVAHELLEDLGRLGWSERSQDEAASPRPMLATVPTVTEFSRASLLAGHLARGDAGFEKSAFAQHAGLRKVSGVDAPPALYHRAALDATDLWHDGLLADIASPRHKIVGVVVNAVDDHLARDGQINLSWRVDTIRPLPPLLEHAARAERAVIIVGDHGHILETGTQLRGMDRAFEGSTAGTGGDRWRLVASGAAGDGELAMSGERVLVDGGSVVVPWSESLRYGPRKWGYHGGITPQETVCPCAVLARVGQAVEGWKEVPRKVPAWWKDGPLVPVSSPRSPGRRRPRGAPVQEEQGFFTSPRAFSVARVNGQVVQFTLPIDPSPLERNALELLVRYGRATERQLARELTTARAGGIMEMLMHKLEAEGWMALDKEADSDDGRIFVFRPERLS